MRLHNATLVSWLAFLLCVAVTVWWATSAIKSEIQSRSWIVVGKLSDIARRQGDSYIGTIPGNPSSLKASAELVKILERKEDVVYRNSSGAPVVGLVHRAKTVGLGALCMAIIAMRIGLHVFGIKGKSGPAKKRG